MNNISPIQTALRYGLILGLLSVLITLVLYIAGLFTNPSAAAISGLLFILIFTTVVALSIANHRKKQGGYITLGKSLVVGIVTSFIGSLFAAIFSYILYAFIDPDLMEAQLKMSEEMMENFGFLSDEQIEDAMENARLKSTPFRNSLNQLWTVCCGGIISLFAGLILKKEPLSGDNTI